MASHLKLFKAHIIQSCETPTNTINFVNLAQAKELSLRREEPSLRRGKPLAQATNSRLGEIAHRGHVEVSLKLAHLAQASDLRLGEPSKQRRGELLLFSLRRELLA